MKSPLNAAAPTALPTHDATAPRELPDRVVGVCWRVRIGRDDCRVKIEQGDAPEQFALWFQNPKGEWRQGDTLIWHASTRTFDSPDRCISFWHRSARQQGAADCIFAYLHRTTQTCQLMPFERELLASLAPDPASDTATVNQHAAWGAEEEGGAA